MCIRDSNSRQATATNNSFFMWLPLDFMVMFDLRRGWGRDYVDVSAAQPAQAGSLRRTVAWGSTT